MNSNNFTCSICGQTFEKGLTDEEEKEQFYNEFPEEEFDLDNCEYVCEDCFKFMRGESVIQ